jgi:hypothetical protein
VFKGGWKIPKGYQETINPGTENIMAKIGENTKFNNDIETLHRKVNT